MEQETTVVTTSFKETQKLGFDFAKKLKGGGVIALHGNLGSGKTTFVQGLAKGLGIEKHLISPTFIIMRTYEFSSSLSERRESKGLRHSSGKKMFYHVDLYRIESERDVEGLGLLEIINDPENTVVIEWPEKIEKLLPKDCIDIVFEYREDDKRKIVFKNE
jgi:tRNA threonylcarbamoyladenosine biosynthesis protein TsaE